MSDYREQLATRSIELPALDAPRYSYESTTQCANLLFVSGQISRSASGEVLKGRLGEDATLDDGRDAARLAALNLLARIHEAVELDNVQQVLKLNVWVSSSRDFTDQPAVAEAASTLLIESLGDAGRHARTALPAHVLPKGALVELDATVAIRTPATNKT
jgi:enamine deaminase RidA (YjgF/YER057c/UK114 family)